MDCRTAQLLLPFLRPGGRDLDPADRTSLDAHLDHCPACGPLARSQVRFDSLVGRAMLAVQPPVEFRHSVLHQLASDRRQVYRRQLIRVGGVAAGLALALFGAWEWQHYTRPALDPNAVVALMEDRASGSPEQRVQRAEEFFVKAHARISVPDFLDPNGLFDWDFSDFEGHSVPTLWYQGRNQGIARVYVVDRRRFKVEQVTGRVGAASSVGEVIVLRDERHPEFAYVVKIIGGQLNQFERPKGVIALA
jgi:hypothetical protein